MALVRSEHRFVVPTMGWRSVLFATVHDQCFKPVGSVDVARESGEEVVEEASHGSLSFLVP